MRAGRLLGRIGTCLRSDEVASPNRPTRVLYFGVRDIEYPRNERIRAFLLDALGAEVEILPADHSGGRIRRYARQVRLVLSQRRDYDVVILSEFSLTYFPFSWWTAKRSRAAHVVDFFVGLHETEVGDDGSTDHRSIRAWLLAWVDRSAIRSANACFTDTQVRADRFSKLDAGRTPFASLPVGAPAWALQADLNVGAPGPTGGIDKTKVRLLYYGSYLALHGLSSFVDAMRGLNPDEFSAVMIGRGPERDKVELLVREYGLTSQFTFIDFAEPPVLLTHIAEAHVVVGVFGASEKAEEVIANKVWQGLYLGKTVITRKSPALGEISAVASDLLVQVDSSDPREIRLAITDVRNRMGVAGGGLEGRNHIRASLESLVVGRYAEAFDQEPYASLFRSRARNSETADLGVSASTATSGRPFLQRDGLV